MKLCSIEWVIIRLMLTMNIIRVIKSTSMRSVGHIAWMGQLRNLYRILVRRPQEKRPLGDHTWKDNIKVNLTEIWCEGMEWIKLAQNGV